MKIGIVLTNDWELYGDGSGDYFDIQHNILNEYLNTLSSDFDAPISLFAEVMQQIEHRKYSKTIEEHKYIAEKWEEIVLKTIELGSDVQLHLHPQWLGAKFIDGKWSLNMNSTAIGQIPIAQIDELISKGKSTLESLIQPQFPNYKCNIFRAGAYCIEPSENVIPILKKYSFIADSSVTKGLVNKGFYDYSKVQSNGEPYFTTESDIKQTGKKGDGLLEMPIFSDTAIDSPIIRKFLPNFYYRLRFGSAVPKDELDWMTERSAVKETRYPSANRYYKRRDFNFFRKAIFGKDTVQLDYDNLPASIFVKLIENFYKSLVHNNISDNVIVPIIASGHFKDIHNLNNLKKIFKLLDLKMKNRYKFLTISKAVELTMNKINGLS